MLCAQTVRTIEKFMNSSEFTGFDLEMATRQILLESDLAEWSDKQAGRLGMDLSAFVSVLLEWARHEDIANDEMFFPGHQVPASPEALSPL